MLHLLHPLKLSFFLLQQLYGHAHRKSTLTLSKKSLIRMMSLLRKGINWQLMRAKLILNKNLKKCSTLLIKIILKESLYQDSKKSKLSKTWR